MTIAVDFDGTIVEHRYPEIGREIPFAIRTLKQLQEERHRLILWTVREGKRLEEAVEFCRERGLEFYAVNSNFPEETAPAASPLEPGEAAAGDERTSGGKGVNEYSPSCRKLKADLYLDDRNLGGFVDWAAVYEIVRNRWTWEDYYAQVYADAPQPKKTLLQRLLGER